MSGPTQDTRNDDMRRVLGVLWLALSLGTIWFWIGAVAAAAHGDWLTCAVRVVGAVAVGYHAVDIRKREVRYQ